MKTPHNTSISFWRIRRIRARRRWAYCRALVAAGLHPIAALVAAGLHPLAASAEAGGGRGLF